MGRPECDKNIKVCPKFEQFGPGGEITEESVDLTKAELEAMRLKNIEGLDQTTASSKMNISQSTFQRLLCSAYKKVSYALVEGKTINIK